MKYGEWLLNKEKEKEEEEKIASDYDSKNNVFNKSFFDTEKYYYYFTEVWNAYIKFRP